MDVLGANQDTIAYRKTDMGVSTRSTTRLCQSAHCIVLYALEIANTVYVPCSLITVDPVHHRGRTANKPDNIVIKINTKSCIQLAKNNSVVRIPPLFSSF